jgi:hypothetical protein
MRWGVEEPAASTVEEISGVSGDRLVDFAPLRGAPLRMTTGCAMLRSD